MELSGRHRILVEMTLGGITFVGRGPSLSHSPIINTNQPVKIYNVSGLPPATPFVGHCYYTRDTLTRQHDQPDVIACGELVLGSSMLKWPKHWSVPWRTTWASGCDPYYRATTSAVSQEHNAYSEPIRGHHVRRLAKMEVGI